MQILYINCNTSLYNYYIIELNFFRILLHLCSLHPSRYIYRPTLHNALLAWVSKAFAIWLPLSFAIILIEHVRDDQFHHCRIHNSLNTEVEFLTSWNWSCQWPLWFMYYVLFTETIIKIIKKYIGCTWICKRT